MSASVVKEFATLVDLKLELGASCAHAARVLHPGCEGSIDECASLTALSGCERAPLLCAREEVHSRLRVPVRRGVAKEPMLGAPQLVEREARLVETY